MSSDDPPEDAGDTASDVTARLATGAAERPWWAIAAGGGVVLVLVYATMVRQELFLVIWLLLVGVLLYLLWRLVRAHERLAAAAQQLAIRDD